MVCVVMIAWKGRGCRNGVKDGVKDGGRRGRRRDTRRVQGGLLIQYLSAKTIYTRFCIDGLCYQRLQNVIGSILHINADFSRVCGKRSRTQDRCTVARSIMKLLVLVAFILIIKLMKITSY